MVVVIEMEYIQYLIIIVLLLMIAIAITRSKKKDFKIEANKLVEFLGGKENILDYDKVNKDAIQKLGAQGIVEIENQLKIILGEDAQQLKKYISALK